MNGRDLHDRILEATTEARTIRKHARAPHPDCSLGDWGQPIEKCFEYLGEYFGNGWREEQKELLTQSVDDAMVKFTEKAAKAASEASVAAIREARVVANEAGTDKPRKRQRQPGERWYVSILLAFWWKAYEHPGRTVLSFVVMLTCAWLSFVGIVLFSRMRTTEGIVDLIGLWNLFRA